MSTRLDPFEVACLQEDVRDLTHAAEQFLRTWDAWARGESMSNDEMLGRVHGLRQALRRVKEAGDV